MPSESRVTLAISSVNAAIREHCRCKCLRMSSLCYSKVSAAGVLGGFVVVSLALPIGISVVTAVDLGSTLGREERRPLL